MSKDHFYFPFYPDDFISGTVGLTCEEVGAYIRLLCYQFGCERIPIADAEKLKRITGTSINLKYVIEKFPNGVNNKLKSVIETIKNKSFMAQQSANMRWQCERNANGMLVKSKSKSKSKYKYKYKDKNKQTVGFLSFSFDDIWNLYPKKDGRKQAQSHFNATVKTQQDFDDIKKALQNYLSTETVQRGYIKNGSTWFNNWRDWIDYKKPSLGMAMLATASNIKQALEKEFPNE